MHLLPAVCLLALSSLSSPSQTVPAGFIRVHGTKILNAVGNPVPSAKLCAQVSDGLGHGLSSNPGTGGQTTKPPVCVAVVNGSFSINLPDTSLTRPLNACISITARDTLTYDSLLDEGYECVQPTSGAPANPAAAWCTTSAGVTDCNFDLYQPNLPGKVAVQYGPVGPGATVRIGTVVTGPVAGVTNAGSPTAAVLDFTLQQGIQGIQGPPGANSQVGNLSGTFGRQTVAATGSTAAFTLPVAGIPLVFRNGVLQEFGTDYGQSGTTITFTFTPAAGDRITLVVFPAN